MAEGSRMDRAKEVAISQAAGPSQEAWNEREQKRIAEQRPLAPGARAAVEAGVRREVRRAETICGPHEFKRRGWRFWICDHCFAPKKLHPRRGWVKARPLGTNYYLSPDAPHFKEGW